VACLSSVPEKKTAFCCESWISHSPWLSTSAGLIPWGDGTFLVYVLDDEVLGEYFRFVSGSVE